METRDTLSRETAGPAPEQVAGSGTRVSIDRFEMKQQFSERTEEEQVEAAMALYEKAARARVPDIVPPDPAETLDSEELEAISQQLKLQQKCQDIAALMMVEELEDELDEEEEPRPRRKQREE